MSRQPDPCWHAGPGGAEKGGVTEHPQPRQGGEGRERGNVANPRRLPPGRSRHMCRGQPLPPTRCPTPDRPTDPFWLPGRGLPRAPLWPPVFSLVKWGGREGGGPCSGPCLLLTSLPEGTKRRVWGHAGLEAPGQNSWVCTGPHAAARHRAHSSCSAEKPSAASCPWAGAPPSRTPGPRSSLRLPRGPGHGPSARWPPRLPTALAPGQTPRGTLPALPQTLARVRLLPLPSPLPSSIGPHLHPQLTLPSVETPA